MKIETFGNVWDAISDSPAEAADLTARSDLMLALAAHLRTWSLPSDAAAAPARHLALATGRSVAPQDRHVPARCAGQHRGRRRATGRVALKSRQEQAGLGKLMNDRASPVFRSHERLECRAPRAQRCAPGRDDDRVDRLGRYEGWRVVRRGDLGRTRPSGWRRSALGRLSPA